MTDEEVAALRRFQDAIRKIRQVYPRMEVGQLEVLLSISTKPGIRGAEILQEMQGIKSNSVYRTIKVLSDVEGEAGDGRRHGLNLITKTPDPLDSRAFQLVPTMAGRDLAEAVAAALTDSRPDRI
ncbi:MarR family winged helix-turn-helix transcriptional regulator [Paracoccus shandongensis]|uniref:MarR family winged helix-turn-helix transcriptional regulator n=1 Tax=Paracoccus shandongensis TaxID=2816048 RepID=UPI001A8E10AE|nr:MarR family winged helix-turn-helix transcriptional regulator [Paracoccus shandongensis]